MNEIVSWCPIAAIGVSLLAVPLIALSDRHPKLRESWTLIAAFIKWAIVLSMLPGVMAGKVYVFTLGEIVPDIPFMFRVDTLGLYFALVASTLWILTSVYSIQYMRDVKAVKQTRYFASFALCLSATIAIAFSANLVTFVISYEILSIATYPLVIHKETEEAIRAGRKYLVYALTAGILFILAVVWTYQISDSLEFKAGGFLHAGVASPQALTFLFVLFIAACGVKAGLMPLHSWLPAAMVAPTPVSALLHAVAVVKAGVFALLRIVGFVFGPEVLSQIGGWQILAWLAGGTLLIASLLALQQDNLKKRLAYSTIAHLSYILLGASLLGISGWQGALLHLSNHAFLKITLFFAAGAIYVKTHRESVSELDGIGRQMPFTMGAFALASIGLVGIPPLNGFISKWFLVLGTLQQNQLFFFVLLLFASLLCGAYLLSVVFRAFFRKPSQPIHGIDEASPWLVVPLCITAVVSLIWGLVPDSFIYLYSLSSQIAFAVLGVGL